MCHGDKDEGSSGRGRLRPWSCTCEDCVRLAIVDIVCILYMNSAAQILACTTAKCYLSIGSLATARRNSLFDPRAHWTETLRYVECLSVPVVRSQFFIHVFAHPSLPPSLPFILLVSITSVAPLSLLSSSPVLRSLFLPRLALFIASALPLFLAFFCHQRNFYAFPCHTLLRP